MRAIGPQGSISALRGWCTSKSTIHRTSIPPSLIGSPGGSGTSKPGGVWPEVKSPMANGVPLPSENRQRRLHRADCIPSTPISVTARPSFGPGRPSRQKMVDETQSPDWAWEFPTASRHPDHWPTVQKMEFPANHRTPSAADQDRVVRDRRGQFALALSRSHFSGETWLVPHCTIGTRCIPATREPSAVANSAGDLRREWRIGVDTISIEPNAIRITVPKLRFQLLLERVDKHVDPARFIIHTRVADKEGIREIRC